MDLLYITVFLIVNFYGATHLRMHSQEMQSVLLGVMSALTGGVLYTFFKEESLLLFPIITIVELLIFGMFQELNRKKFSGEK